MIGRGPHLAGAAPFVVDRQEIGAGASEPAGNGVDLREIVAVLLGEPPARDGVERLERRGRQVAGRIVDQRVCAGFLALERLHRVSRANPMHRNAHEAVSFDRMRHAKAPGARCPRLAMCALVGAISPQHEAARRPKAKRPPMGSSAAKVVFMPEVSSPANSDGPKGSASPGCPAISQAGAYSQAPPRPALIAVKLAQSPLQIDNLTRRSDKAARSRPAFEPGAQDALPEACVATFRRAPKTAGTCGATGRG